MEDQNGSGSIAGAAALAAFCALALRDPALQTKLRQPGCSDQDFIVLLVNAARRRGFAFGRDDVQRVMRERMLAGLVDIAAKETPLPPDGWLPVRASWQEGELYAHWGYFGARRLREPFFEADVRGCFAEPFNRVLGYVTAVEKLSAWLADRPHLKPSGFIFHMSRCGSTLVSQMLAAVDSNIVVSEASPIDTVVQVRHWRAEIEAERQSRWLAAMIGALGQTRCGDERHYFIKLDSWHTLALPLFRRAFPDVPWIFLYRDPIEVMVSQLRMPGTQMVPTGIGPSLYGIERAYGPGTAEDYYAQVLAKICEAVVPQHRDGGGLLVNYQQLPDALFTAILPHFGVAYGDADRAVMAAAARFDAKAPDFEFAPDSPAKQQAASPATRAATERWLNGIYDRLETLRAGPIGGAAIAEQS